VHGAHRPGASEADVGKALDLLADAKRPVFFIGQGTTLAEAGPEISALQKQLGIPVITSPNGMGCVPADDPLTLGFIGRNGAYPANQAGRHADLVICIGTRFDDRSSSSWHRGYSWNFPTTRLLQVDIDPAELGRNYPPTLGIIADAKVFAAQLLAALPKRTDIMREAFADWRSEVAAWVAEWEAFVRPNFSAVTTPIRPEYVVGALLDVLPDDVILSLDSGVHHNWFMQFWKPKRSSRACSIAGAIRRWASASAAPRRAARGPERPCVAVVGDVAS